jgi:hypothetical protein
MIVHSSAFLVHSRPSDGHFCMPVTSNTPPAAQDQLDVVIAAHPKDFPTLNLSVDGAVRNVAGLRNIFVVSPERYTSDLPEVRWIPEPNRPDFPTVDYVRRRWERENPKLASRAGWVYQQLLSLGAAAYIPDLLSTYLCIDADTIFLRQLTFVVAGKRFVYSASAYEEHEPYLKSYRRLTGEEPLRRSFTAHHMVYDVAMLEELFAHIARLHKKPWFDAYLDSIDYAESSPVNEQDLYGNWMVLHHPALAVQRQLAWADIRYVPTRWRRKRLARDFDFVSAHAYMRQPVIPRLRDRSVVGVGAALRRLRRLTT